MCSPDPNGAWGTSIRGLLVVEISWECSCCDCVSAGLCLLALSLRLHLGFWLLYLLAMPA